MGYDALTALMKKYVKEKPGLEFHSVSCSTFSTTGLVDKLFPKVKSIAKKSEQESSSLAHFKTLSPKEQLLCPSFLPKDLYAMILKGHMYETLPEKIRAHYIESMTKEQFAFLYYAYLFSKKSDRTPSADPSEINILDTEIRRRKDSSFGIRAIDNNIPEAAANNSLEEVLWGLMAGLDVNHQNKNWWWITNPPAIAFAEMKNNADMAKILLVLNTRIDLDYSPRPDLDYPVRGSNDVSTLIKKFNELSDSTVLKPKA